MTQFTDEQPGILADFRAEDAEAVTLVLVPDAGEFDPATLKVDAEGDDEVSYPMLAFRKAHRAERVAGTKLEGAVQVILAPHRTDTDAVLELDLQRSYRLVMGGDEYQLVGPLEAVRPAGDTLLYRAQARR